jgi:hypothetical protein
VRSGLHLCNISTCLILITFWLQDRKYFAGVKTPPGWTRSCCFVQIVLHHETWRLACTYSTENEIWCRQNLAPFIHSFMSIKKYFRSDTTETWWRLWYYMIVHNLTSQVFNSCTTHCPLDSNVICEGAQWGLLYEITHDQCNLISAIKSILDFNVLFGLLVTIKLT